MSAAFRLPIIFVLFSLGFCHSLLSQNALEDVQVEIYYIADAEDATDRKGGRGLPEGAVTYRIYIDLADSCRLLSVYGNENHGLRLATNTRFFSNTNRGGVSANDVSPDRLRENTVALDSWLSMGGASAMHLGVPKNQDNDGNKIAGEMNDGGSEKINGGLLKNTDPKAGVPLSQADGLKEGKPANIVFYGMDPYHFLQASDTNVFESTNAAWATLGGTYGLPVTNKILIAQLTTDGGLDFQLNIQVARADGKQEKYVSTPAVGEEIFSEKLRFRSKDFLETTTKSTP